MKRSTKAALIFALCCILLGTVLGFYSVQRQGFDWKDLSLEASDPVDKTHTITETFRELHIEDVRCDIRILPASDQQCTVICSDCHAFTHNVEVRSGTLYITSKDTGHPIPDIPDSELLVYLPDHVLDTLALETVSGNVEIHEDLCFREAEISGISGNLQIRCDIRETLRAETVSGRIELENMQIRNALELETISGNVVLDQVDAPHAQIQSVSGDITCDLPTKKHIVTNTISGTVRTEDTPDCSETWYISTTSGSILVTASN